VHLFANAMRSCGSDEFDALMPSLLGSQILAPQGRVQLDPGNHHAWLYPRIGRANAAGQFTIVRESAQSVSPDPYLVKHSLEGELRAPCFRRA
jgi:branched-chain amino acid transport system substrate-binding protein